MKTAISVPEAIYDAAERLARRLQKSRSQLYAEAMAAYLLRHDSQALTAAYDRVLETLNPQSDPFVEASARRVLTRSEW